MRRSLIGVLTLATLVSLVAGCAMNKAEQGAIVGAGAGGVAGAVVGKATGSTVRGAIIGAVVGGAAGAVIGHQMMQAEGSRTSSRATVQPRRGHCGDPPRGRCRVDSDELAPTARDNLRKFAASLAKYPNTRTLIVGHTDAVGGTAYNMDLSERRALSAANFITGEGVDRARISTAGRGETEPIATNDSDDGRHQNRRVEIAIYATPAAGGGSGN
jgi:outer membrane protein OmpA-like peptidoglycan-associated protein